MPMVRVKYQYRKTSAGVTTTQATVNAAAKTESAVLAVLRRRHPGYEIVILSID